MADKTVKYKEKDIQAVGNLLNMLTIRGVQNSEILTNIVHILNNTIIKDDEVEDSVE